MKQLQSIMVGTRQYSVGQEIVKQQFPRGIDSRFLTTEITGTVRKIIETRNAGFMTIETPERMRLVCLG